MHWRNGEQIDSDPSTPAVYDREVTDYVYDLLGNVDQVRLPNGAVSDYTYDELNRLTLLRQFKDGPSSQQPYVYESSVDTLLAKYDYDLADDGHREAVHEKQWDPATQTHKETYVDWAYDDIGRLLEEHFDFDYDPQTGFDADRSAEYTFDLVGNRLVMATDTTGDGDSDEAVTYEYDANDRLLTEGKDDLTAANEDRFTAYEYDATQQTKKTVWPNLTGMGDPSEITDYAYNLQGRMATVKVDSDADGNTNTQLEYEYNDNGIRVAQTKKLNGNDDGDFTDPEDTSAQTDYLVDPLNPTGYAQVLEEWVDGMRKTTYTLGLDVIAQDTPSVYGDGPLYFIYDGHGSTRALVTPSGAMAVNDMGTPGDGSDDVVQIFTYDAYGNPIGFEPAVALTSLLYSGEQFNHLTGLQYLRARYYDLATGRFTRLDPFAGNFHDPQSLHKYLYTHGDPLNGNDPRGMFLIGFSIGGLLATAGYVAAGYFAVAATHKVVCIIGPPLLELASALGEAMNGEAPPSTYWSPTANMPMSVPAADPTIAQAQERLDYIHRLRVEMIAAGDDIVNNRVHGYSVPGPAPLDAREWRELRSALRYARWYDDYGFDVALRDGPSINNPLWHGITLNREGFLGTDDQVADDAVALTLLVHEPMHNLFYWWLPYKAIGHWYINPVVGPYSQDNYFNDLVDYLKQSTKNGETWWDHLRNNAAQ